MSKTKEGWITLDGSHGEGGGQILRSGLTLSMLTGRPFRMTKIRANREKPGLRPQHLSAVESAALLCGAQVSGASVGSRELRFEPGPILARDLTIDIGTAGSTALVLHTLFLPIALRSDRASRLTLVGGTFNIKAPSYPFLESTWLPHLADQGFAVEIEQAEAGFYPRGGGRLVASISPVAAPRAIVSDRRSSNLRIKAQITLSRLDAGIGDRMLDRVNARLSELGLSVDEVESRSPRASSPGVAIALTAMGEGTRATFVGLGERGKPAETVADEAFEELIAYLSVPNAAIDAHSADQILLPLALAEGRSVYTVSEVTEHLRTNAQTVSAFLDRPIRIEESEGGTAGRVIVG